jgi:ferrous iron transport protein A
MSDAGVPLARVDVGSRVRIASSRLEADISSWLAAVGLAVGEELVVLRRAAFGGPLHVRTASGGEFAVAAEVATCLEVVHVDDRAP